MSLLVLVALLMLLGFANCAEPTSQPSNQPTTQPSSRPTTQPSSHPTIKPSCPTSKPSNQPTTQPSNQPTSQPSNQPTTQPSNQPTTQPSSRPTTQPSSHPTIKPSCPTSKPSNQPTTQPSSRPTTQPSNQPTSQPSSRPTTPPSSRPSAPTFAPTISPTTEPTIEPTLFPTSAPSSQPSMAPTCASVDGLYSKRDVGWAMVVSAVVSAVFTFLLLQCFGSGVQNNFERSGSNGGDYGDRNRDSNISNISNISNKISEVVAAGRDRLNGGKRRLGGPDYERVDDEEERMVASYNENLDIASPRNGSGSNESTNSSVSTKSKSSLSTSKPKAMSAIEMPTLSSKTSAVRPTPNIIPTSSLFEGDPFAPVSSAAQSKPLAFQTTLSAGDPASFNFASFDNSWMAQTPSTTHTSTPPTTNQSPRIATTHFDAARPLERIASDSSSKKTGGVVPLLRPPPTAGGVQVLPPLSAVPMTASPRANDLPQGRTTASAPQLSFPVNPVTSEPFRHSPSTPFMVPGSSSQQQFPPRSPMLQPSAANAIDLLNLMDDVVTVSPATSQFPSAQSLQPQLPSLQNMTPTPSRPADDPWESLMG